MQAVSTADQIPARHLPACDQAANSHALMQVGFFEVIVMPLFKAMADVLPAAQPMLDAATKNYYCWRMQKQA